MVSLPPAATAWSPLRVALSNQAAWQLEVAPQTRSGPAAAAASENALHPGALAAGAAAAAASSGLRAWGSSNGRSQARRGAARRVAASATQATAKPEQVLWEQYPRFVSARGGSMEKVTLSRVDGVRGVVATCDIAEGETIIEIPIEASIDITDPKHEKDPTAVAVNFLKLYKENAEELQPYFDMLPSPQSEDMQTMPDFFSDEGLQLLQCPPVARKTHLRRELCAKRAAETGLPEEEVRWALCTVAQRAFSVMSPVDGLLRLMLPGIDLFNHDAHAQHLMKVRWDLEGYVSAVFKVIAGSPIKKGDEIRICYGGSPFRPDGCGGDCTGDIALTNAMYLQRYGFVDECFGTTMVDGKWLVSKEAADIPEALAQTSLQEDEAMLAADGNSAATRTAVRFRAHLKRALCAQREADARAAAAQEAKGEAEKAAEEAAKKMKEEEARVKEANAAEAKKQLIQAISEE